MGIFFEILKKYKNQEFLNLAHSCLAAPSIQQPALQQAFADGHQPAGRFPPAPEHLKPVMQGAGDLPHTGAGHRCQEGNLSS